MLERLKLQMEEQSLTAIVAVKNREVRLACYHGEAPEPLPWRVLESGRRFLRRLERVHITAWKKRYAAEAEDDHVAPWTIDLIADGVKRRISGDAYPENWPAFVDVMNELPGVALPKIHQVEQLTLLYEGALAPVVGNPYAPRAAGGTLVEKIAISRGKHILILTRHKQGFGTDESCAEFAPISISSVTGEGIEELRERMAALLLTKEAESALVTNSRHIHALAEAKAALETADAAMGTDLAAADIRTALYALGQITGREVTADVIERIFSRFCVGE